METKVQNVVSLMHMVNDFKARSTQPDVFFNASVFKISYLIHFFPTKKCAGQQLWDFIFLLQCNTIKHVNMRSLNFWSVFGNLELNADLKIQRKAFFWWPRVHIFFGSFFAFKIFLLPKQIAITYLFLKFFIIFDRTIFYTK